MVDGGFQEEAEARAKFDRARLSSTQLSTYFAGSMEMWDIELEARRRARRRPARLAAAAGLPGGFGETPGFRYRDHLESVIGHGAPPTSLLRRIAASAEDAADGAAARARRRSRAPARSRRCGPVAGDDASGGVASRAARSRATS